MSKVSKEKIVSFILQEISNLGSQVANDQVDSLLLFDGTPSANLDSLAYVELVMVLEDEFNVELSDDELEEKRSVMTVAVLAELVFQKL
jgi:acyl carrier protein